MNTESLITKLKNSITHLQFFHRDNSVSLKLDRYRRHDHGGGSDGESNLPDHKIDEDFETGRKKYQDRLDAVNVILKKEGFAPNAEFYLSEKGNFSIEIWSLKEL